MLLIKTYLDKSRIHGLGVFAGEFIAKGTHIWRFVVGFDRCYSSKQYAKLPKPARDFIRLHGYRWKDEILLSMDNDSFMNHSEDPNTYFHDGYVIARSDIRKDTEITNDYRAFAPAFCAAFLKKQSRPRARAEVSAPRLPIRPAAMTTISVGSVRRKG
jgi:SET domain-containing protein